MEGTITRAAPEVERRGTPLRLLPVWAAANLGLPALVTGVAAVSLFGLGFVEAALGLAAGNGAAAVAHGVLSARGAATGLTTQVLGRRAFGDCGNALPAFLAAVTALLRFVVVAVGGALALSALGLPGPASLAVVAVPAVLAAAVGPDAVRTLARAALPVLVAVFALAAVPALGAADLTAPGAGGGLAGLLLTSAAAFVHTALWTPTAADLTRHLPFAAARRAGLLAGLGSFGGATAAMLLGAAAATGPTFATGDPARDLADPLPGPIGPLLLLGVALAAVVANAVLAHSAALAVLALDARASRGTATLGLGALATGVALLALDDAAHEFEAALLVLAAWIAPWLAVTLTTPRRTPAGNLAGPLALLAGWAVSAALFSAQELHVGTIPATTPGTGDLTPLTGCAVAALLHTALRAPRRLSRR